MKQLAGLALGLGCRVDVLVGHVNGISCAVHSNIVSTYVLYLVYTYII